MVRSNSPNVYQAYNLHVLDYARASWQRLGHIKMLCSVANPSFRTNLEGITSRFRDLVTRPTQIPEEYRQQITNYLKRHRSNQYKIRDGELQDQLIELQDFFLSDPTLPAQSGALTGKLRPVSYLHTEYVEIPAWAVRLRLIRNGNYTLTDRGKALIALLPSDKEANIQLGLGNNPFILSNGEKVFFIYCILEADGDILKRLYSKLLLCSDEYSKTDVRNLLSESYKEMVDERIQHHRTIRSRIKNSKFINTIKVIDNQSDQMVFPRVEPMVDCGLITRSNPYTHVYKNVKGLSDFVSNLRDHTDILNFLETSLVGSMVDLLNLKYRNDPQSISKFLAKSYTQLRSGLGYCSIRELSLLTVAHALNETSTYFELHDIENLILSLASKYGTSIRFTKNRQGKIALVRIDRRLIEKMNA